MLAYKFKKRIILNIGAGVAAIHQAVGVVGLNRQRGVVGAALGRLDAAVAREITARGQMDAARALAAVGRRRRYAVPLEAAEGIAKAMSALK